MANQIYTDEQRTNAIRANINYRRELFGISIEELAAAARMSRGTYFKRMADPESFTLKECRLLAGKLKTTPEVLMFGEVG